MKIISFQTTLWFVMHNLTLSDCINLTGPFSLQASDANGITQNLLGRKRSASDVSLEQDNGNAYASSFISPCRTK